ncbi:N-acetylmuramoyl-L-alanine amidase [Bacillus toyonensis]|uniref:C39 family peptidase n=1 Tax=Bacillus toyonensis TaxID=155322 RepID=UPI000BFC85D5|nr:C39 family peptidase [Bacillus toyonensis]PHE64334.1 N-acetylmuramoyl-L-alanine amidase [Bacillus toyonensis]
MKASNLTKLATTGLVVLGALTFPSSSLAEVGNQATKKIEMVQGVQGQTDKTEVVTQKDLLKLQDYLKQQEKLFVDEDKLKEQQNKVIDNEVAKKDLENKLTDLHSKQDKLQKEIQSFKESIKYPVETVDSDKKDENKVETEKDAEKEYLKKREDNKKEAKDVQDKLQELKVKEEQAKKDAELKSKQEEELKAKQEAELKAKQDAETKAKQEADLKAKQEAETKAKQDAELKAKQESELKVKEEADLKAKVEAETKVKEEQQKKDAETKAKQDAELKAKQEVELKAKQDADNKAKQEAELKEKSKIQPRQAFSPQLAKSESSVIKQIKIDRVFYTYNEPSLSSGISSGFAPQTVNVVEERSDGWIKIKTYYGEKWMLLQDKRVKVDKVFYTYNEPSLSSGISSGYAPQTVTVVEEGKDGWMKIKTYFGEKWMNLKFTQYKMDRNFYSYNEPSLSSGVSSYFLAQTVNVLEERNDGWMKIETGLGQKWVQKDQKKVWMTKTFYLYNDASLSSGIASDCGAQPVGVIEERADGWIKIDTWLGHKWVKTTEKKVWMNSNFYLYNDSNYSSGIASECLPQPVGVIEERAGGWIKIGTWLGEKWVNTIEQKTDTIYFDKVFFAYDSPNFSSNVAGKFAPQTVTVKERRGSWLLIKTGYGDKWVNKDTLTNSSVMLDVPNYYQYPSLYNGCEVVSLQMLVEYHTGQRFNMVDFAMKMPMDTTPMVRQNGKYKTWGDPDVGFVGDVTGNKPGFSINPAPLKRLLDQYAKGTNLTGQSFSVLENYVRNGKPVVAWVTEGLTTPNNSVTWKTPQGKTIYAKFNTHAVTITGVDGNNVYYNDPVTGQKNAKASKSHFESIYNQMGQKALSIN